MEAQLNARDSILFKYGEADAKSTLYFRTAERAKTAFWVSLAGTVVVLISLTSYYNNFWTDRTPDEEGPTIPACTVIFWAGLSMLYFYSEWEEAKKNFRRASDDLQHYQGQAKSSQN